MKNIIFVLFVLTIVGCSADDGDVATFRVCKDETSSVSKETMNNINQCIDTYMRRNPSISVGGYDRVVSSCKEALSGSNTSCKNYVGVFRGGRVIPCSIATTEREREACGKLSGVDIKDIDVPEYKHMGW